MYAQSYRWHMARASHWDEIYYVGELPFFKKVQFLKHAHYGISSLIQKYVDIFHNLRI